MRINILNKGDKVINVTTDFIAIERKNKEVDIIPLIKNTQGLWVDSSAIVTIGFGCNFVETETEDGIKIINF